MTASTTTTIRGVSIFSRQQKRKTDVFDIALSQAGIVIQRPGRSDQRMGWDRISEWEIEERPGCVVLTLRGGGSVTPLMVKGWTLEDLETVMRDATEGSTGPESDAGASSGSGSIAGSIASSGAVAAAAPMEAAFAPPADEDAVLRVPVEATVRPDPAAVTPAVTPAEPRAARRQAAQPARRGVWKPLVTIVLLGVLATAVTVVLLQSAGIINWSFLGPVA